MGSLCCSAELPGPPTRLQSFPEMGSKVRMDDTSDDSSSNNNQRTDESVVRTEEDRSDAALSERELSRRLTPRGSNSPSSRSTLSATPLPNAEDIENANRVTPAAQNDNPPVACVGNAITDAGTDREAAQHGKPGADVNAQRSMAVVAAADSAKKPVKSTTDRETEDGAYLTYTALNDGSLFIMWRKEAVSDALAFARRKSGIRVPAFKYKGRLEVSRHLHRTKRAPILGLLQFLRSMVAFQPDVWIYEPTESSSRIGSITFFAHLTDNRILIIPQGGEPLKLPDADAIAACYNGSSADTDLRLFAATPEVTLSSFMIRCKQHGDQIDTITLFGSDY